MTLPGALLADGNKVGCETVVCLIEGCLCVRFWRFEV